MSTATPPSPIAAPIAGWDLDEAPFHSGEIAVQARAGVQAKAEVGGRRGIRRFMPEQHRLFFGQLPFIVLGGIDTAGRPWATLRTGEPGFVSSPDAKTLRIAGETLAGDPLAGAWQEGSALGGLGIELPTRRRNRVNGKVARIEQGDAMVVTVRQSFGNCAKYIQSRTPTRIDASDAGARLAQEQPIERATVLSPADRALIERSDTYFIATRSGLLEDGAAEGVDVSHRGGLPGFVRVENERTFVAPDYRGNLFFNTLGNLATDARAGLVFIDFERGDVLYVAAQAEIVWDESAIQAFPGAERLVRFSVDEIRRSPGALPYRWSEVEYAPQWRSVSAP
ncbi:pyridoxamine 5'-phosphate oxidase [Trinickia dabaoshanensis]|uniref:Pyridoxamine 5'-phosphate oxidase n=1 Tax=Trinickia dabaoshanensis TaxID=564714 RepID=A0A2N7VCZ7_9BURK|nr:pyridoxamine 5'-phosphate oxidase [Trinickia dabaoshanensis]